MMQVHVKNRTRKTLLKKFNFREIQGILNHEQIVHKDASSEAVSTPNEHIEIHAIAEPGTAYVVDYIDIPLPPHIPSHHVNNSDDTWHLCPANKLAIPSYHVHGTVDVYVTTCILHSAYTRESACGGDIEMRCLCIGKASKHPK
jgi:hypothetical protein